MGEAILAVVVALPLILTFLLKSNAALGFLALTAGYALQSFAATDSKNTLDKTGVSISSDALSVFLILVPFVITLLLCRGPSTRSVKKPKTLLNYLAAIASGATFALMAVPLMGNIGGSNLTDARFWNFLFKAESEIIASGVVISLVLVWLSNRKSHAKSKHHK